MVKEIDKILNITTSLVPGKIKEGGTLRRCPSQRKLFKFKKFENNFSKGMIKTVEWYKNYYLKNEVKNELFK